MVFFVSPPVDSFPKPRTPPPCFITRGDPESRLGLLTGAAGKRLANGMRPLESRGLKDADCRHGAAQKERSVATAVEGPRASEEAPKACPVQRFTQHSKRTVHLENYASSSNRSRCSGQAKSANGDGDDGGPVAVWPKLPAGWAGRAQAGNFRRGNCSQIPPRVQARSVRVLAREDAAGWLCLWPALVHGQQHRVLSFDPFLAAQPCVLT